MASVLWLGGNSVAASPADHRPRRRVLAGDVGVAARVASASRSSTSSRPYSQLHRWAGHRPVPAGAAPSGEISPGQPRAPVLGAWWIPAQRMACSLAGNPGGRNRGDERTTGMAADAAACACDITSAGVRHGVVLERCLVLSGVNAFEDGRLRVVSAIPAGPTAGRSPSGFRAICADGNRAVVAR